METIQKGKQTNKQTNKQAGVAHVEAWMQGAVWSCIACRVQYAMYQSMWKSFGDASEKCRVQYTGLYSDSLLTTIASTQLLATPHSSWTQASTCGWAQNLPR